MCGAGTGEGAVRGAGTGGEAELGASNGGDAGIDCEVLHLRWA